ncbi:MAG: WecB/TagA/CpsF family glycosyltransferase [Runella zeae]
MKTINILGIAFWDYSVESCYEHLNQKGGLMMAPSGPGLGSIAREKEYYESVQQADVAIPDSGYMVLLWNLFRRPKIKRLSGLAFINYFVEQFPKETNRRLLLVNPTPDEQRTNVAYLQSLGVAITEQDCYIAPLYAKGKVEDAALCAFIEAKKPDWVLINIGGGTQEILGAYLKKHLSYQPALICTGAAIAFKTGKQVHIPAWADQLYLGWLVRIASAPSKYYKRYLEAIPLLGLILKYGTRKVTHFQS